MSGERTPTFLSMLAGAAGFSSRLTEHFRSSIKSSKYSGGRSRHKNSTKTSYKPAFSIGFRGKPRTYSNPSGIPAPTLDQVRRREREFRTRIVVKKGLMYFKSDSKLFDLQEASIRLHDREHKEYWADPINA